MIDLSKETVYEVGYVVIENGVYWDTICSSKHFAKMQTGPENWSDFPENEDKYDVDGIHYEIVKVAVVKIKENE